MGYICTRCGGTNVACEAIVNPNTGKIIDYFDGSFMHAICSNCENEVIISNIEEVKHEIDLRFHEFVERTGKEPEYVEEEDDYFPFSSASIVAYEYKLLYHEKFFEHLHMKRLVIDENIPFPVSTWERSYRYKGYGYNMCRETKKKLLQALKGVNVEEEDVSLYATGGWD
jgi:predicted nucleic-acid-binding Zn-ribbon protein